MIAAALVAGLVLLVRPAEAAFPGANGKIVFSSNRTTGTGVDNPTGDSELFTMNNDGTGIEQLTFNTADDYEPRFSADGGWIAYTSDRDGNYEIYMRSYGGNLHIESRLTTNTVDDGDPTFSSDTSKIAFTRSNEIYIMDTNPSTSDGTNLTNNATAFNFNSAFSPVENKIAFESTRGGIFEIFVMDTDP